MTNVSPGPTAAELFRMWQAFLDGNPASATSLVDSASPEVAGPLRRLIDDYFDSNPTEPNPTAGGPTEPEPPPVIPGYTVLGRLGRGGMGEVFRVRDALDREHALKVARRGQLSVAGRERFRAEAHAMARLDHPNVVRVGHYGDVGGRPYFEMPLYPANLADRLADYTADPRAAVRLLAQVADGVGHLHAGGFVHRDLKPSNILLTADGRPAVSDFGLIKGLGDSDPGTPDVGPVGSAETNATGAGRSHTVAGMVLGTRRYMAPDQAAGHNHQAGPAWDVWALGVMLHELLTGQPPRSSDAPERLLNTVEPDNPPPTRVKPGLDPRLSRVVEKCLARDAADRYPNGSAVAADLNRWLHRRRRQWTAAVAASLFVTVVAGVILGAMTLFRHRPPSREQVLADIQRQLRDGRPVELIGPTGEPRWFDVVAGGRGSPYVSDADGTFRIATDEVALIELPPTGLDRYRFEVQIQGQVASPATRFGAYAGRHRLPSTHGPTDCFATLWFNEQAKYRDRPGPDSPAQLGVRYHQQVPGTGSVLGGHSVAAGPPSAMPIGVSVPWRTIAVDVLPDRMTWSFDGDPAGSITLPLVPPDEGLFAQSAGLLPGMTTAFAPAGGYGLVVHRGTAAVRNARLVPIER